MIVQPKNDQDDKESGKIYSPEKFTRKLRKVERDLNFVVDETIEVGDIVKEIGLLKNKLLVSVVPKNIFRHSSIGDLKKSVTINLEFQHPSKTLEDKDVNLIINEIINVVSKNFNAKLRQ